MSAVAGRIGLQDDVAIGDAEVDIRLGLRAEQTIQRSGGRDGCSEVLPASGPVPVPLTFRIPRSLAVLPPLTSCTERLSPEAVFGLQLQGQAAWESR